MNWTKASYQTDQDRIKKLYQKTLEQCERAQNLRTRQMELAELVDRSLAGVASAEGARTGREAV